MTLLHQEVWQKWGCFREQWRGAVLMNMQKHLFQVISEIRASFLFIYHLVELPRVAYNAQWKGKPINDCLTAITPGEMAWIISMKGRPSQSKTQALAKINGCSTLHLGRLPPFPCFNLVIQKTNGKMHCSNCWGLGDNKAHYQLSFLKLL